MGDGILILEDEHAHNEGKMWACPQCDYVIMDLKHQSWPAPLSLEEKRELEDKYAPNIIKIGVGVIPFFQTIKEEEDEESGMMDKILAESSNPHADFLNKQCDEGLEQHRLERKEKKIQDKLDKIGE